MHVNARQVTALLLFLTILIMVIYPSLERRSLTIKILLTPSKEGENSLALSLGNVSVHRTGARSFEGWINIISRKEGIHPRLLEGQVIEMAGEAPIGKYDAVQIQVLNASVTIDSQTEQVHLKNNSLIMSIDISLLMAGEHTIKLAIIFDPLLIASEREFEGRLTTTFPDSL